jgi:hypothetical protein
MSHEAVTWAMDFAPMLLMPKSGENDTTARAVLIARAERADADGRNSHAGIEDVVWRTGYTRNTVRDAEKRLEAAGLMVRDGKTSWGSTRWRLVLTVLRDPAERDQMIAKAEEKRAAHAKRESDRRASRALSDDARARLNDARARLNDARASSVDPEPSLNHPGTVLEPSTGERPPRTPPHRDASGATDRQPNSSQSDQDQPLQGHRNSRPREPDAPKSRKRCEHGFINTQTNPCLFCRRGLTTTGDTP